jgi:hypothetical protein
MARVATATYGLPPGWMFSAALRGGELDSEKDIELWPSSSRRSTLLRRACENSIQTMSRMSLRQCGLCRLYNASISNMLCS